MASKNTVKQITIKDKERNIWKSNMQLAAIFSIIGIYVSLMVSAYTYDYPRENLLTAIVNALQMVVKKPLYFWPLAPGALLSAFGTVFIIFAIFALLSFIDKLRVHHDIDTLKGSTKWADIDTLLEQYAEGGTEGYSTAYYNAILSQNFQMSINMKKHFHALNTLILGATGSGKSRYFLKPNLLQMNTSYVVTDPSGGILQSCGETLRRFGYNVKVFDLVAMGNCDTYNPMKYCKKESDVKKLVQAFVKNANMDDEGNVGKSNDPFWDNSMNAFMCAGISLLVNYGDNPEIMNGATYQACFANLCELTRMANRKAASASAADVKNNTASGSELNMIFENVRNYELAKQQEVNPKVTKDTMIKPYCLREWENFRIAPEKTSTTILMTAAVQLDAFNIEQIKDLTSSDTLNLDTFGNSRDVLFVITPTNDRTYNFLVAFMYTQLFDLLYTNGEKLSAGSKDLKLANGELVKHFTREEVAAGIDEQVAKIKNASIRKVEVNGEVDGRVKHKKKGLFGRVKETYTKIKIDDSYYEIIDEDENLVSRRPTEELANEYVHALKSATLIPGNGESVPTHVRFLLDEFPNLGTIPQFKEKLATMRKYEISCTVICQSITQLKGLYEKDYEVIDANCPQTIFLGGDENANNEYISKKLGKTTVVGRNNSAGGGKNGSSFSYNVEERDLMKPEEIGRIPFTEQLVMIYGEQPILDKKYDYVAHKNYKYTADYAKDVKANAYQFDKEMHYGVTEKVSLVNPVRVKTSCTPNAFELNVEAFMGMARKNSISDTIDAMQNDFAPRYGMGITGAADII